MSGVLRIYVGAAALLDKARRCKAKGCSRRTRNAHGYCFQHADMRFFTRTGYGDKEARLMAKQALADAAEEDGYDGP